MNEPNAMTTEAQATDQEHLLENSLVSAVSSEAPEQLPEPAETQPTAAAETSEQALPSSEPADKEGLAATSPTAEPASDPAKRQAAKKSQSRPTGHRHVGFIAQPVSVSQKIKKYRVSHPGLVQDKYAILLQLKERRLQYQVDVEQKSRILQKVVHLQQSPEIKALWQSQLALRNQQLAGQQVRLLNLTLNSPLTVESHHPLSPLGVDLHPLFGFPILSAIQIKGALQQYLQQHWLPNQADRAQAQQQLIAVFGRPGQEDAGQVIFHDAWPESWPQMGVEQLANHHSPYYQRQEAPGDWQIPERDCYLVIRPQARFQFAFGSRRPDQQALLEQVEQWLQMCLQQEGFGAYRSLGFGRFKGQTPAPDWQCELQLSTPAFVAGNSARPENCQLSSHTLKGLLRWWWRTLYSGFLNKKDLLMLETLIWGGRHKKASLLIQLEPQQSPQPRRFRPEDLLKCLPRTEGEKRSPGLMYLTYGLLGDSQKRYYLEGSRWQLKVQAQATRWQGKDQRIEISSEELLDQFKAALWLLCHYGGVGQRKRKGLGSFADLQLEGWNEDRCLEVAQQLRERCHLHQRFEDALAESPSLMQRIEFSDIQTPWKNAWFAMHQVGECLQNFMQAHKHEAAKKALGLPRFMEPPVNGEFEPGACVTERHAAPYYLHFARLPEGQLVIRTVAFPAAHLPNAEESQRILTALMTYLREQIQERVEKWPEEPDMTLPPAKRPARPARAQGRSAEQADPEQKSGYQRRQRPEGRSEDGVKRDRPPRQNRPERGPRPERGERKPRPERQPGERQAGERFGRGERPDRAPRGEQRADRRERGPRQSDSKTSTGRSGVTQAGDWVQAVLLEEKTKKGGWRAQHLKSKLAGPLLNTGLVPGDVTPGQEVELLVHACNQFEMIFRWPTEADQNKRNQPARSAKFKK